MTKDTRIDRLVFRVRAMLADANNMAVRRDYLRATFNLDRTAEAIAALADKAGVQGALSAPASAEPAVALAEGQAPRQVEGKAPGLTQDPSRRDQ